MAIRLFVLIVCISNCVVGRADEAVEIPLSDVWGYRLPGTKDIGNLEQKPENYSELAPAEIAKASLVEQIRRSLSHRNRQMNQTAGTAFVVDGTKGEALRNAHDVFTQRAERQTEIFGNKDHTLVFYAYTCGRYTKIDSITWTGKKLVIKYHFEAHNELEMTSHFALIPLPRLPLGDIEVSIIETRGSGPRIGPSAPQMEQSRVDQIVSNSFGFSVVQ